MVNVGIIGLGSVWETRYRPALEKLRQRVCVSAVYDPVANRAEQVAAECGATAVKGLLALLERADIQAILLLGTAWQGQVPLRFVSARRMPVLIAGNLGDDLQALEAVHQAALADGLTLMPEFPRRYTPATGRLQELIATHIGRPERIVIDATIDSSNDSATPASHSGRDKSRGFGKSPGFERPGVCSDLLIGLFDWCRYILQTTPAILQSKRLKDAENDDRLDHSITIEFHRPRSGGNCPVAELRIHEAEPGGRAAPSAAEMPTQRVEVVCERGKAILDAPAEISWATDAGLVTESLAAERSAVEVMLDHYLRRVVGGLIPVADISDVCQGIRLVQAAQRSLQTGQRIELNG